MSSDNAVTTVPAFANRLPSRVRRVIFGNDGYRAGCRLAIFAVAYLILVGFLRALQFTLLIRVLHIRLPRPVSGSEVMPWMSILFEGHRFIAFMIASWIMSRIEKRPQGAYGLPLNRTAWKRALEGMGWGFGGITIILCVMRLLGAYEFGSLAVHGATLWSYAAWWTLAFLCTAFFEEYQFRGYSFKVGVETIGFCPTALISSLWFAVAHIDNSGETKIGILSVLSFALCFCWILKRTGSLWMPVGIHFAWDLGQSFIYGVPDSGLVSHGRLLVPAFHGPDWLTGGSVGPEGSLLTFLFLGLMALAITLRFNENDKNASAQQSTAGELDYTLGEQMNS